MTAHRDATGGTIACGDTVRLTGTEVVATVASLDGAGVWVTRSDRPGACFCHRATTLIVVSPAG